MPLLCEVISLKTIPWPYYKIWALENPARVVKAQEKSYKKNGARYRETARLKRLEEREQVLSFYGKRCICCDTTTNEFLTIDHVFGRGRQHLKSEHIKNIYTWFCRKFPDGNFPREGFQVLCYNCNCAKGHYGYCPHKKDTNA